VVLLPRRHHQNDLGFSKLRFGTKRSVVQNPFAQSELAFRIALMTCSVQLGVGRKFETMISCA
jgi:hypothetical protein